MDLHEQLKEHYTKISGDYLLITSEAVIDGVNPETGEQHDGEADQVTITANINPIKLLSHMVTIIEDATQDDGKHMYKLHVLLTYHALCKNKEDKDSIIRYIQHRTKVHDGELNEMISNIIAVTMKVGFIPEHIALMPILCRYHMCTEHNEIDKGDYMNLNMEDQVKMLPLLTQSANIVAKELNKSVDDISEAIDDTILGMPNFSMNEGMKRAAEESGVDLGNMMDLMKLAKMLIKEDMLTLSKDKRIFMGKVLCKSDEDTIAKIFKGVTDDRVINVLETSMKEYKESI